MNNQEYNKAENLVDKTENSLRDGAQNIKEKTSEWADKARDYINRQRANDQEATQEGWFESLKNEVADGWESVKDHANDAWEKAKDLAVDAEAEIKKRTN